MRLLFQSVTTILESRDVSSTAFSGFESFFSASFSISRAAPDRMTCSVESLSKVLVTPVSINLQPHPHPFAAH